MRGDGRAVLPLLGALNGIKPPHLTCQIVLQLTACGSIPDTAGVARGLVLARRVEKVHEGQDHLSGTFPFSLFRTYISLHLPYLSSHPLCTSPPSSQRSPGAASYFARPFRFEGELILPAGETLEEAVGSVLPADRIKLGCIV